MMHLEDEPTTNGWETLEERIRRLVTEERRQDRQKVRFLVGRFLHDVAAAEDLPALRARCGHFAAQLEDALYGQLPA